jgi:hypothetical protein
MHHIAIVWVIIELHTPDEGAQGHEAPHHAAVFELVPDGLHMVWASLLEEHIDVVPRWPHLMLVTGRDTRDASHTRATRLPIVAVIVVGHGHLMMPLAPLFATLDAFLSAVDGDIEWQLLVTSRSHLSASLGWAKRNRLMDGGV